MHTLKRFFKDPHFIGFIIWYNIISFFVFASCLSLSLETVTEIHGAHPMIFSIMEWSAVIVFTVDFFGNLCFSDRGYRYVFSFWGIVDLLSILPSYLMIFNFTALQGVKVLRILRVARVLRVLKLAKAALMRAGQNLGKKRNPIVTNLVIYVIILFSVLMISSTAMYYFEGGLYTPEALATGQQALDLQKTPPSAPEKFMPKDPIGGNPITEDKRFFTSIPAAMWWSIVTLTTTGYGDMYPTTAVGRIIAGLTMICGMVLFGILLNVIGKTMMVVIFGEALKD